MMVAMMMVAGMRFMRLGLGYRQFLRTAWRKPPPGANDDDKRQQGDKNLASGLSHEREDTRLLERAANSQGTDRAISPHCCIFIARAVAESTK
jgi:hypothetical protein